MLQPPQFLTSFIMSTQTSEQQLRPGAQAQVHWPAMHTLPMGHTLPHALQLAGSDDRSTHTLPHSVVGGLHTMVHLLAMQLCPTGHTLMHAPQFFASLVVSVHAPPQKVRL